MTDTQAKTLGDLRREAGLSQAELADKAGISAATIRKLERGGAVPNLASLKALEAILGSAVYRCEYGQNLTPKRRGRPRKEVQPAK